jgi:cobalt-precorrin 5A hydrolase/precorrin-3B C17-methyltransferase
VSDQPERSGVAVIAVTRQGTILGSEIVGAIRSAFSEYAKVEPVTLHVKPEWNEVALADARTFEGRLGDRVAELWPHVHTFVFVLAVGATLRIVAPLLGRKQDDPGVICVDDAGQFVIPALGGHQIGANWFAESIADAIGAQAVVTTASEAAGLPTLDRLGYWEAWSLDASPETVKDVSAAILAGAQPTVFLQFDGYSSGADIPTSWPRVDALEQLQGVAGPRIAVTDRLIDPAIVDDGGPLLVYRPHSVVLGVGCSSDATPEEVEALARSALAEAGLDLKGVFLVTTVDKRVRHPAILHLVRAAGLRSPLGYSAEQLAAVTDVPSPSDEVLRHMGTPSVCEAAAILGSSDSPLVVPKRKSARATVAVAQIEPRTERSGKLWLVGIGPGPLDLMTPRARRAIRQADAVIGYRAYLDQLRPIVAARRLQAYELGQERERAAAAIRLAREGNRVALVSSGDIGIYGMAGLVYELLDESGSSQNGPSPAVEVVPGVTAASSAGALLGAPLMLDFAAISLSNLLVPWESIQQRLRAAAEGDLVVVLYNPASARRRQPFDEALAILRQVRSPETPVGLVREAYRPDQQVTITTLGDLPAEQVDMRTVVVVGCSRTAVLDGRIVTRRGYLDREAHQ